MAAVEKLNTDPGAARVKRTSPALINLAVLGLVVAWVFWGDVLLLLTWAVYTAIAAEFIAGQTIVMTDRKAEYAAHVRSIARDLVFLGLIGTVVGFIIALSGVNADAASDPKAVAGMVSTLIDGMGVALGTTLMGAIGSFWLRWCARAVYGPR